MLFETKKVTLKNGKEAVFRSPSQADAAAMVEYMKLTAAETHFLLRTPEECTMTAQQEADFLQHINDSRNTVMIVCEVDGKLAGNCQLAFGSRIRTRHRASVAIALLKDYWGLGIGTAMFEEMTVLSRARGALQMELEFVEGNERARRLYEKMGFRTVAEKPNAIRLEDGTLLKEYFMVKELTP